MHRTLKMTGSLYLHCDPTASHYLKVLLDQVFGADNFRNEIIWRRSQPKGHATSRLSSAHDIIFVYSRSGDPSFLPHHTAHATEYLEKFYKYVEPGTGRRYTLDNLANPNKNRPNLTYEFPPGSGAVRVWSWTKDRMIKAFEEGRVIIPKLGAVPRYKRYLDEMEGTLVTDLWTDIEHLHGSNKESLGYQTQKPLDLLQRIIDMSSKQGDTVLDPFCGCGTAIVAAEKLGRKWIGIDITHLAVSLIKKRIKDHFPDAKFEVVGEPKSVDAAQELFKQSPFQFETWAVSLIGGQPFKSTGGGDTGIDGFLFFQDFEENYHRIIIEVKGGDYQPKDVRSLAHVLKREEAPMGILIALKPPTKGMLSAAAEPGKWTMPGSRKAYPVLQIITIQDFYDDKKPELPDTSETLRKAKREVREREKKKNQPKLGLEE